MNDDAEQLRCQARHCRDLAEAHYDHRTQLMLRSMAKEFDEHAAQLEVRHLSRNFSDLT